MTERPKPQPRPDRPFEISWDERPAPIPQLEDYLGLLHFASSRFNFTGRKLGFTPDDLVGQMAIDFIRRAPDYDPERGTFTNFMLPILEGSVKRMFRDAGWIIRPPRPTQEAHLMLTQLEDDFTQRHRGQQPTLTQLAIEYNIDEKILTNGQTSHTSGAMSPIRIHHTSTEENEQLPSSSIREDSHLFANVDGIDKIIDRQIMVEALALLDPRSRRIVALRIGLTEEGIPYSQSEIAEEVGISQVHVSRLLKAAYKRIRAYWELSD